MAMLAYWNGQTELAPVSNPVGIFSATRSGAADTFRDIQEFAARPIQDELVRDGGSYDRGEFHKGFELSKGRYVLEWEQVGAKTATGKVARRSESA